MFPEKGPFLRDISPEPTIKLLLDMLVFREIIVERFQSSKQNRWSKLEFFWTEIEGDWILEAPIVLWEPDVESWNETVTLLMVQKSQTTTWDV